MRTVHWALCSLYFTFRWRACHTNDWFDVQNFLMHGKMHDTLWLPLHAPKTKKFSLCFFFFSALRFCMQTFRRNNHKNNITRIESEKIELNLSVHKIGNNFNFERHKWMSAKSKVFGSAYFACGHHTIANLIVSINTIKSDNGGSVILVIHKLAGAFFMNATRNFKLLPAISVFLAFCRLSHLATFLVGIFNACCVKWTCEEQ